MKRLLLLLAAGCATDFAPDVGAPLHGACSDADSDPAHDVRFSDVVALFASSRAHCLHCHSPEGATPIGLDVGGLDLSEYDYLREGGVVSGTNIVIPGQPCESVLIEKASPAPPFGARMPLDGPPFLDAADAQLLADWIAEGAHED